MYKLVVKRQRNQRSNCQHLLNHQKSRKVSEKIYFCFIDYVKAFDCVDLDHNKLENSSRDGNTDHLTCLLRNLYSGQEATVRNRHGKIDWFEIEKGVSRLYIVTLLI